MFKRITAAEAAAMIKDGSRVAIGGFLAVGAPKASLMLSWLPRPKICTSLSLRQTGKTEA